MGLQALEENTGRESPSTAGAARYRVILDCGTTVDVVLVDASVTPRVGDRLSCHGTTWRIWTYRRHAKAFVAHPAEC